MEVQTVEVNNGLKFKFNRPGDVLSFNELAQRGDRACLDDAVSNNIYRTGLPEAWDLLAKRLFEEFKIARPQKPHPVAEKAAKGETVDALTDPKYVNFVADQKGVDVTSFQVYADEIGVIDLDLTERKGTGGTSLVGKGDMDMAKVYMQAGHEKLKKALAKIAKITGEAEYVPVGDEKVDQLKIALQIKAFRAAAAKGLIA